MALVACGRSQRVAGVALWAELGIHEENDQAWGGNCCVQLMLVDFELHSFDHQRQRPGLSTCLRRRRRERVTKLHWEQA